MSNLTTEYRRRISKLLEGKAKVAQPGTNHIDDNWDNDTIYKGELGVDLNKGKLYTSDGETAVELNKRKAIANGLQLYPVPAAASDRAANNLWIAISSGSAVINGKTYWHTSVFDAEGTQNYNGDFMFEPNELNKEVFNIVYAKAADKLEPDDKYEYDKEKQQANLSFFSVRVDSLSALWLEKEDLQKLTDEDLDSALFLGVVWMPEKYNKRTVPNSLRLWSCGVTKDLNVYNWISSNVEDSIELNPGTLVNEVRSCLGTYVPGNQRELRVVVEGQLFLSGNALYLVKKTHLLSNIDYSLDKEWIIKFGGEGSRGVEMHANLGGLNFGDTGHEGTFQRRTSVSVSGPSSDSNTRNGDFWIKVDPSGILQAGYVYYDGNWIEFINNVRESYEYKDFKINQYESYVFHNKQTDTFIRLEVNGVGCNYGTDYYFTKKGESEVAKFEDIDNTSEYIMTWCSQDYQLDEEDSLSISYIESDPIIIDTTEWNVLEGGSSTNGMW